MIEPSIVQKNFIINGIKRPIWLPENVDFLVGKIQSNGDTIVSESMREVVNRIRGHADGNDPIVIDGEIATGKGFVARILRVNDPLRKNYPFVLVNCQAIEPDKFESAFFGDVKLNTTGYFQEVGQGTLYIKDIINIPSDLHSKLLEAVKYKRGKRVGSMVDEQYGNFRVIIGSQKKLRAIFDDGKLDQELFHHLQGLDISLPSLKDRQSDIIEIADYFLEKINKKRDKEGKSQLNFDKHFKDSLKQFSFFLKGNIEELEGLISGAAANCCDETKFITNDEVHDKYPTFGIGIDNLLVKYFHDHLIKIKYKDRPIEDVAMSIASTFYTKSDRLISGIASDRNLHILVSKIIENEKMEDLETIKFVEDTLENKEDDLIFLFHVKQGKKLEEIAKKLGKTGAALTETIKKKIYKLYKEGKSLDDITELFKNKKSDYIQEQIIRGLYDDFLIFLKEKNGRAEKPISGGIEIEKLEIEKLKAQYLIEKLKTKNFKEDDKIVEVFIENIPENLGKLRLDKKDAKNYLMKSLRNNHHDE